jgi:hypothetical protein
MKSGAGRVFHTSRPRCAVTALEVVVRSLRFAIAAMEHDGPNESRIDMLEAAELERAAAGYLRGREQQVDEIEHRQKVRVEADPIWGRSSS